MRTIHKMVLELMERQIINIPRDSKILCVREQHERMCAWFECDTDAPKEDCVIITIGTGDILPDDAKHYLGSCQIHGGRYVFHVYEGERS